MLDRTIFTPALLRARAQTRGNRTLCAKLGIRGVLDAFTRDSVVDRRSRSSDGLTSIDNAVNALRRSWQTIDSVSTTTEKQVEDLLKACAAWIDPQRGARSSAGFQARGSAVYTLQWQVAWAYACANYAKQARLSIGTRTNNGVATSMIDPVAMATLTGNPYHFTNSGYREHFFQQPARLLRGDTRGPGALHEAGGFFPRNHTNVAEFKPWFEGHSTGDTISTTTNEGLAIEAGPAAHNKKINAPEGALPDWLKEATESYRSQRKGFVYELGGLLGVSATHRVEDTVGVEHVFLAIPNACITRWWVVLMDRTTLGPFPYTFPLPTTEPTGWGRSAEKKRLA